MVLSSEFGEIKSRCKDGGYDFTDSQIDWLVAEVERLQAENSQWREIVERQLGECDACEGDGFHDVVVGFQAPDGREETDIAICQSCRGTGRGELAAMLKLLSDGAYGS